jgi:CDP-diglyceride synthetase
MRKVILWVLVAREWVLVITVVPEAALQSVPVTVVEQASAFIVAHAAVLLSGVAITAADIRPATTGGAAAVTGPATTAATTIPIPTLAIKLSAMAEGNCPGRC